MHHILGGAARHLALALGLRASTLVKSLPEQPAEKTCAPLLKAPFLTGGLQVSFLVLFLLSNHLRTILCCVTYCSRFNLYYRYYNPQIHLTKRKVRPEVLEVQRAVHLVLPHLHQLRF